MSNVDRYNLIFEDEFSDAEKPNSTDLGLSDRPDYFLIFAGSVLGMITIVTVIGNFCVLLAVIYGRFLRYPQYMLIFSLAFTDLTLGVAVLPFSVIYEVDGQKWTLGGLLCELWISLDVLCCTASIWHLVAIALDRFRSIKSVHYSRNRTAKCMVMQIILIWVSSFVITMCPFLGWKDHSFDDRIAQQQCLMSQDVSYQMFSTVSAFYVPLALIMLLYYQILKAARKRSAASARRRLGSNPGVSTATSVTCVEQRYNGTVEMVVVDPNSDCERSVDSIRRESKNSVKITKKNLKILKPTASKADLTASVQKLLPSTPLVAQVNKKKQDEACRREKKAATTLAILTGTFVVCWFPFFILALVRPVCNCTWPVVIDSVVLWLGYINSTLNPIVYTIFSPDFRNTFKRMFRRRRSDWTSV